MKNYNIAIAYHKPFTTYQYSEESIMDTKGFWVATMHEIGVSTKGNDPVEALENLLVEIENKDYGVVPKSEINSNVIELNEDIEE